MNGESAANAIYGNALNNYLEHFQAVKEWRKKANRLSILSEYLRNIPPENPQMPHHNKEQLSVGNDTLVNNDIIRSMLLLRKIAIDMSSISDLGKVYAAFYNSGLLPSFKSIKG